jgi:hypothetical protein
MDKSSRSIIFGACVKNLTHPAPIGSTPQG